MMPAASSQQPAASSQQPAASSQQPAASRLTGGIVGQISSLTRDKKITPLSVKDVTAACISKLKAVPLARNAEGFSLPAGMLADRLIPQTEETSFLKLYITPQILKAGKLDVTSTELFPNYVGRVFEIEVAGVKQLMLVGFSSELASGDFSNAMPFLVYIPPSPQDNPEAHRKQSPRNKALYATTPAADIPYFYKDATDYPYAWDWLYFQIYNNMYRLAYQLKKADTPYVFVVPLVRSFTDGIGVLNDGSMLERALLGIQTFFLDAEQPEGYQLDDLRHVTLAAFSIGTSIMANFIDRNRENPFLRDVVKDLVVLDPNPGNPKNRSPIISTIVSMMRGKSRKSVMLYGQDTYYVSQLVDGLIKPAKIPVDITKDRIFDNPKLRNIFFAYLEARLFTDKVQDPIIRDAHNTFPNLFINHAARRGSLAFKTNADGKRVPLMSFLEWFPTKD